MLSHGDVREVRGQPSVEMRLVICDGGDANRICFGESVKSYMYRMEYFVRREGEGGLIRGSHGNKKARTDGGLRKKRVAAAQVQRSVGRMERLKKEDWQCQSIDQLRASLSREEGQVRVEDKRDDRLVSLESTQRARGQKLLYKMRQG